MVYWSTVGPVSVDSQELVDRYPTDIDYALSVSEHPPIQVIDRPVITQLTPYKIRYSTNM